MELFLQVFSAFFSAFLFAASLQNEILPLGSPFLGLLALIPLYICIYNSRSFSESGLLTALQVLLTHLLSSFWLVNFKDFAVFTLGASALGTAAIGFAAGLFLRLPFGAVMPRRFMIGGDEERLKRSTPFLTIPWFASVWLLYEWVKSNGFLAYPWGTISMSAWSWNEFIQYADISGVWGISFLIAFFASCAAECLISLPALLLRTASLYNRERAGAALLCTACCGAFFASALLYGAYRLAHPLVPEKELRAVIVQHNVDSWNETGDDGTVAVLTSQALTEYELSRAENRAKKPDLVVWSESVIPYTLPENEYYYRAYPSSAPLIPFIKKAGIPFIIGGPVTFDRAKRSYGNSALLFDSEGNYAGFYAKMQLVPFAEVIPFGDNPLVQRLLNALVGFSSGWTPGDSLTLFDIPLGKSMLTATPVYPSENTAPPDSTIVRVSIPICFEDAFPSVCRALFLQGSELFVNITNDSWSRTKSAEYQHFAVAAFRTIEFRSTMLRATNSGYSVVIDPTGRVIRDLPLFESSSFSDDIPIYPRVLTVYARLGDWLPWTVLLFVCITSGARAARLKRDGDLRQNLKPLQ